MSEELLCSICFEIAEKAVETSCCHHIFCEACLNKISKSACPMCRSRFKIQISHTARRIIDNNHTRYPTMHCDIDITRLNSPEHEPISQYQLFVCPKAECSFYGDSAAYLHHLTCIHADAIVKNSHMILIQPDNDLIGIKINAAGRKSRIGITGKYYCNGALGEFKCTCCDGTCGPKNGCNCKHCMALDIQTRRLPMNHLVNREGVICRRNIETDRFYCGRFISQDGNEICGPVYGPSCRACLRVNLQAYSRYGNVWSR